MVVEVSHLSHQYQRGSHSITALDQVSLSVGQGEFVAIMGPSGSGKSTLLQLIGGLERPSSGSIKIEGKPIEHYSDLELTQFRRRRLGFVFQFFNLLPTMTALENVMLPLLLDGRPRSEVEPAARHLLERVQLAGRGDHYPSQLSGGQMQRVAIARALIARPVLLLADEPTGNLDSSMAGDILGQLRTLAIQERQTILMVTHDPKAAEFGTRRIELRDGRVESDLFFAPTREI